MKRLIVPIICFSLALCLGSMAWADSEQAVGDDEKQGGEIQLLKKKVTVEKKNSQMVTTSFGESYRLESSTLIVGEEGQQVMIEYLLVPCDAELLYETKANGSRFLHRIKVLSTQEGATNRMWEKPK